MAQLSRFDLEAFFELNDIPTSSQYSSFIESGPNIIDDYDGQPAFIKQDQRLLSIAEIDALFATPIDIVPAPGPGFANQLIGGSTKINFATTAWVGPGGLFLFTNLANDPQIRLSSVFDATASGHKIGQTVLNISPTGNQIIEDEPIQARVTADLSGGDTTVEIFVQYITLAV